MKKSNISEDISLEQVDKSRHSSVPQEKVQNALEAINKVNDRLSELKNKNSSSSFNSISPAINKE
jgi:hypothetical protein